MPPEPGKSTSSAKSAPAKLLGDDKSGQKKSNSELALQETSELEEELAALRATYEQYFLGNERFPPLRNHEELKKRLLRLKGSNVRNTAAKFRLNSLHNKFLTYERLWTRTLQEIEAGTYKRDILKAKRRAQKAAGGERRQEAHDLTEELSDADLEDVSDIIPNEPVPAKVARPAFIPQPVEPVAGAVSFRGAPAVAPVPSVPTMAPIAPVVAPVIPAIAPAASTPFRATPPAASGGAPSIPSVAPVAGTPFRGAPSVAPVAAVPSVPAVAPAVAPVRGPGTSAPVAAPARGAVPAPSGGAPARGAAPVPAGGTPARGTPGGAPARGVPSFGTPPPGGGGIAAALEGLTDEPLSSAPAARPPAAAARPGAPGAARPAASSPRPATPGTGAGLSDDKLRAVYDAYVTAKKRNQEDTSKMSFESVAANLRKQVPDLLKQHNAKNVEFKVVIKDGKATLKAVPK
ncbi:hypothetical protein POL68_23430 [Stigmatella sp. ncwal1]|uniref:Uncharacterized protein n=1 Tax=Stigmatella ashevillensis TaxID=2995309 RepID=A0ABT5DCT8_9BACT|nr:MXAN_5187 C-terminal domain-containing protein [Stigmatella ashevillena]MDC0711443.1 hypothetical protein [Stigmatella ashevillena]